MRCKNCGWENPEGAARCEKCNAPLQSASIPPVPPVKPAAPSEPAILRGTLPENKFFGATCPKCGYPLAKDIHVCPNCGEPAGGGEPVKRERPGTVNPWDTPQDSHFCTLRPIAWQNENIEYTPVSYSGDSIALNRANTDPNNQSITSKEQAELTCEDGVWYIEDKSGQQTTYVHAGRKMKLEDGDIIILGNRRFEFKG